jgi:arylsulfatase A-like enzyme
MKHVRLLLLLSISFLLSCSDDAPQIAQNEPSPNIVLIIADDLGWDVFGNYPGTNGSKANTPTLDSLTQNGITFMNFWSNPICAPTRAAILTGKYGFRTGVGGAQTPQTATLSNSETVIQKYISDNTSNAYSSAVIGKWHVSSSSELNAPENFGVDYYSGIFRGSTTDYFNWNQTSSGIEKNITTYTTTHFVDQSIGFNSNQSPFFFGLRLMPLTHLFTGRLRH